MTALWNWSSIFCKIRSQSSSVQQTRDGSNCSKRNTSFSIVVTFFPVKFLMITENMDHTNNQLGLSKAKSKLFH